MTPVCLNVPQWVWITTALLLVFMIGLYLGTWADFLRNERADHRRNDG